MEEDPKAVLMADGRRYTIQVQARRVYRLGITTRVRQRPARQRPAWIFKIDSRIYSSNVQELMLRVLMCLHKGVAMAFSSGSDLPDDLT